MPRIDSLGPRMCVYIKPPRSHLHETRHLSFGLGQMLLSDTVEISRALEALSGCNLYITYINFTDVYPNTKNPFWKFLSQCKKTYFYVAKINWSWRRKEGLDQCMWSKVSNIIYKSKTCCFKNWGISTVFWKDWFFNGIRVPKNQSIGWCKVTHSKLQR